LFLGGLAQICKLINCVLIHFLFFESATIEALTAVIGKTTGGSSSTTTNRSSLSSLPVGCDQPRQTLALGGGYFIKAQKLKTHFGICEAYPACAIWIKAGSI
jgi:hypothetical protein